MPVLVTNGDLNTEFTTRDLLGFGGNNYNRTLRVAAQAGVATHLSVFIDSYEQQDILRYVVYGQSGGVGDIVVLGVLDFVPADGVGLVRKAFSSSFNVPSGMAITIGAFHSSVSDPSGFYRVATSTNSVVGGGMFADNGTFAAPSDPLVLLDAESPREQWFELEGTLSGGSDTDPDQFAFVDQEGVAESSVITSASIAVTGINAAAAISVGGGEYSINGGVFDSVDGLVNDGDSVVVRHTSASSAGTATNTVLVVGSVQDTFTSTTAGGVDRRFDSVSGVVAPGETFVANALNSSGAVSASLGGEPLVVLGQDTSGVTLNVPVDINVAWGASLALELVDTAGARSLAGVVLSARPGWGYVVFDGSVPDAVATESFFEEVSVDLGVVLEAGDQVAYTPVPSGTVYDDTTFESATPWSGNYRVFDASSSSWTTVEQFATRDQTPDAFAFSNIVFSDVQPGSVLAVGQLLAPIVGAEGAEPISVSAGEWSLDDENYRSVPGFVGNGDQPYWQISIPQDGASQLTPTMTIGDRSISLTINIAQTGVAVPVVVPGQIFSVSENVLPGTIVGSIVTSGDAADSFSISGSVFAVDNLGQISLAVGQSLDFGVTNQYLLSVTPSNAGGAGAAESVTINVTDVNEAIAPVAPDLVITMSENDPRNVAGGVLGNLSAAGFDDLVVNMPGVTLSGLSLINDAPLLPDVYTGTYTATDNDPDPASIFTESASGNISITVEVASVSPSVLLLPIFLLRDQSALASEAFIMDVPSNIFSPSPDQLVATLQSGNPLPAGMTFDGSRFNWPSPVPGDYTIRLAAMVSGAVAGYDHFSLTVRPEQSRVREVMSNENGVPWASVAVEYVVRDEFGGDVVARGNGATDVAGYLDVVIDLASASSVWISVRRLSDDVAAIKSIVTVEL